MKAFRRKQTPEAHPDSGVTCVEDFNLSRTDTGVAPSFTALMNRPLHKSTVSQ